MAGEFWASPNVEPKRSYRFYMKVGGIEKWTIKRVKRPDFTMSEVAHEYINHKFWYPGRVDWSPVSVTLVDPVKPDNTGILLATIMASGYRLPGTSIPTMTPNKAAAVKALGSVEIFGLGGAAVHGEPSEKAILGDEAVAVERWKLVNPWIKSVEFGDYSYSDDSIIDLSMTIRYDYATYEVMESATKQADWNSRISQDMTNLQTGVFKQGQKFIAGTS